MRAIQVALAVLALLSKAAVTLAHVAAPAAVTACFNWSHQGPFRMAAQWSTEGIPNATAIGAVSAFVFLLPAAATCGAVDADAALLGTTNGGVWRSDNARTAVPHWYAADMANCTCASIGAIAVDPWDAQHVLAGCAGVSSLQFESSELNGLMESRDAGRSWRMLPDFPFDLSISAIAFANSTVASTANSTNGTLTLFSFVPTILVSVRAEYTFSGMYPNESSEQRGVWRGDASADAFTWSKVTLPGINVRSTARASAAHRLAADPNNASFVVVASPLGVHVSHDGGASWTPPDAPGLDVTALPIAGASNAVVSIASRSSGAGSVRVVWVGFAGCPSLGFTPAGCAYAIYRSIDDGASWQDMPEPGTIEAAPTGNGTVFANLGSQGMQQW